MDGVFQQVWKDRKPKRNSKLVENEKLARQLALEICGNEDAVRAELDTNSCRLFVVHVVFFVLFFSFYKSKEEEFQFR